VQSDVLEAEVQEHRVRSAAVAFAHVVARREDRGGARDLRAPEDLVEPHLPQVLLIAGTQDGEHLLVVACAHLPYPRELVVRVERDRPDSTGARKVMLVYSAILAVKLTSVLDLPEYRAMGFE